MTGPLALACGSVGVALLAYPLAVAGLDPMSAGVTVLGLVFLAGSLRIRRWSLLGAWGAAFLVVYLMATRAPVPPLGIGSAFLGMGLLALLELFDRLCAAAASEGGGALDTHHALETAFSLAAGGAGALLVLLAGGVLRAGGPVALALAAGCALGAAATVVVLSGRDEETAEEVPAS